MTSSLFNKPALFLSTLFHPLLVPTYAIIVLVVYTSVPVERSLLYKTLLVLLIFLTTFVTPMSIILILRRFRVIKSLQMPNKEERIVPLLITGVSYFLTYQLLKNTEYMPVLTLFMMGATVLIMMVLLITYLYKISIHGTAWGGFLGAFLGYSMFFGAMLTPWLLAIILITGMTGSSRLVLHAHTNDQVYSGILLGFLSQYLLFYFV